MLFVFLTDCQAVLNGIAAAFPDNVPLNYIDDLWRFQLTSQFEVKFQDLKALFGLDSICTLMNVLEDNILDILLLQLQQPINICELLMRVPLKLVNNILVIISEAVFNKHNSLVNIYAYDCLVILCDFSLEIFIGILVVDWSIRSLSFLLEE